MRRIFRGLCVLAVGISFVGCAMFQKGATPDPAQVDKVISEIQTTESAIKWILPLASGVVAIFAPEAIPAMAMATAADGALNAVTDASIAAYKQNPSAVNASKLTDVLGQLKEAWNQLDGAYKADPKTLATLKSKAAQGAK